MAANAEPVEAGLQGFMDLGTFRQISLMIGLAAAVAVGVSIVMWSQEPAYGVLYTSTSQQSVSEVVSELDRSGIKYKLDPGSGAVLVPSEDIYKTRLILASSGLPRGTEDGYELLDKEQSFGTSKLMEVSRFKRATEGELARSIESLHMVRSARVHLALPKPSVFVRKTKKPTASVILDLGGYTTIGRQDIEGIAYLVASGVPELEPSRVSIVDQRGRLLSKELQKNNWSDTSQRFEYTHKMEDLIVNRVQEILIPIVGQDGVRAQVAATLDFTQTESSQEEYNPDSDAIRSEQINREFNNRQQAGGIPGALTNQPPPAGVTTDEAGAAASGIDKSSNSTVRNYELNRSLSHSKFSPGSIRKLSVAVVVANIRADDGTGTIVTTPRSAEQMQQITDLVRQAVGFDAERGDIVTVTSANFITEELVAIEETPIWKDPFVLSVLKQFIGPVLLLALLFGVLKPTLNKLIASGQKTASPAELPPGQAQAALPPGTSVALEDLTADQRAQLIASGSIRDDGTVDPAAAEALGVAPTSAAAPEEELVMLEGEQGFENRIEKVRQVISEDPARAAQVVRGWVEAK